MESALGLCMGLGGETSSLSENQMCRFEIGEEQWLGTPVVPFYKHGFVRLEITIYVTLASASEAFKKLMLLFSNERFPFGCIFTALFQCESKSCLISQWGYRFPVETPGSWAPHLNIKSSFVSGWIHNISF